MLLMFGLGRGFKMKVCEKLNCFKLITLMLLMLFKMKVCGKLGCLN